jgi:hypothetical protein
MFDKHLLMWEKNLKFYQFRIVCDFGLGAKLTQLNSFNVFKWEFIIFFAMKKY